MDTKGQISYVEQISYVDIYMYDHMGAFISSVKMVCSISYTKLSIFSGGARALKLGGGAISRRRREPSRGVRGLAPPGKF